MRCGYGKEKDLTCARCPRNICPIRSDWEALVNDLQIKERVMAEMTLSAQNLQGKLDAERKLSADRLAEFDKTNTELRGLRKREALHVAQLKRCGQLINIPEVEKLLTRLSYEGKVPKGTTPTEEVS